MPKKAKIRATRQKLVAPPGTAKDGSPECNANPGGSEANPHQLALQRIHDLLYLDLDGEREFYNPKKTRDANLVNCVARIVAEFIPRPCVPRRQPSLRRIREIDCRELFENDGVNWRFCCQYATMSHREACEFLVFCDARMALDAVEFGCTEKFVVMLQEAAVAGETDLDNAWLWLYA